MFTRCSPGAQAAGPASPPPAPPGETPLVSSGGECHMCHGCHGDEMRWGISQGLSPFKWIRMGKIQDLKGFERLQIASKLKNLKHIQCEESFDFGMPIES